MSAIAELDDYIQKNWHIVDPTSLWNVASTKLNSDIGFSLKSESKGNKSEVAPLVSLEIEFENFMEKLESI